MNNLTKEQEEETMEEAPKNPRKGKRLVKIWLSEYDVKTLFESTSTLAIVTVINEAKIRGDIIK